MCFFSAVTGQAEYIQGASWMYPTHSGKQVVHGRQNRYQASGKRVLPSVVHMYLPALHGLSFLAVQ